MRRMTTRLWSPRLTPKEPTRKKPRCCCRTFGSRTRSVVAHLRDAALQSERRTRYCYLSSFTSRGAGVAPA